MSEFENPSLEKGIVQVVEHQVQAEAQYVSILCLEN